ncbi:hypothetical protein C7W93_02650 [Glaciimonas sp. PCH181]|nr:hypothetical protein C7W93_02650 [Glaciimonas sp. PCH181]
MKRFVIVKSLDAKPVATMPADSGDAALLSASALLTMSLMFKKKRNIKNAGSKAIEFGRSRYLAGNRYIQKQK